MVQFMQENKALGVESMCKELAIAPSTYYRHVQLQRHPGRRGAQVRQREARLVESNGFTTGAMESTARARSGNSCYARASRWHTARLGG